MSRKSNTEQILKSIPDLLDWQVDALLNAVLEAKAIASKPSKCRSCNASIVWGTTKNGKNCPLDYSTGQSHFKTCPQANSWSKPVLSNTEGLKLPGLSSWG